MRLRDMPSRDVILLLAWLGLAAFCAGPGCGKPGYMLETDATCRRLNAVNAKENAREWALAEIKSHMAVASNRPISLTLTNVPKWVDEVERGYRAYTVVYEADPGNDHVSFDCFTGRGCWGFMLGGPQFVPSTNRLSPSLFYLVKGDPGLYAWHGRSDN